MGNFVSYWHDALTLYLRRSFYYGLIVWLPGLAMTPLASLIQRVFDGAWKTNWRLGLVFAGIFGAMMFAVAFTSALVDDAIRNRGCQTRQAVFRDVFVWKFFLACGGVMFMMFAFFAFHEGVWLTVLFAFFAVLSWVAATKCFNEQPS